MNPIKNKYRIPSLARACQALKMFAGSDEKLSSSEVARRLAIPRTTALRILHTLWSEGLLSRENLDFCAGSDLLRLGLRALSALRVRELSVPFLQQLSHATGETSHLAVLSNLQSLIIEVCDSPHPVRAASRAGTLVPLHCAATGKVLLAFEYKDRLRDIIENLALDQRTPNTIVSIENLMAECERVLKVGYAIDNEEYYLGVRCMAAPVWDATGRTVAAVGVTASSTSFPRKKNNEMAKSILRVAAELSRSMGFEEREDKV